ncbi:LIM domain-containing protein 1 [Platysternon megacephalum]|uniref:LIM domain-containing protein 1 n=1 Tax=Platysternon megacephalum TaxID=55544 RepID=A0A4D9ECE8_9SAUR|nr:LIM domain-containing protein 1 [Platysternon megacephalum]
MNQCAPYHYNSSPCLVIYSHAGPCLLVLGLSVHRGDQVLLHRGQGVLGSSVLALQGNCMVRFDCSMGEASRYSGICLSSAYFNLHLPVLVGREQCGMNLLLMVPF